MVDLPVIRVAQDGRIVAVMFVELGANRVTGYGRAEKQQIMEMTRVLLGLAKIPKPDDTADALALAICHGHSAGSMLGKINLINKRGQL